MNTRVSGFTLIEMIFVILILSVLTAVIVPKLKSPDVAVAIEADRMKRDIRHMQMLAISWEQPMHMTVSGTGYSVRCYNNTTSPCNGTSTITDPATNQPFSVTFQYSSTSTSSLEMDSLGRPTVSGSVTSSNSNFVLTGGSTSKTVQVIPVTGFVQVN